MGEKKESRKRVELLSFVDDFESLKSAINAGSDSVCFDLMKQDSGEKFLYGLSEIEMSCGLAKIFDVRILGAINSFIKNSEINTVLERVAYAVSLGLDGIVLFDVSLAPVIRKKYPDLFIIASDKNTVTNSLSVDMLKDADSVMLAKELSKDEIVQIRKKTSKKLQMHVYSPQCFSYEGHCLFGSFRNGHSANREVCSALCVKCFKSNASFPRSNDACLIKHIPEIIKMGIETLSLNFSGKSPSLVNTVCSIYRKAIDSYYDGEFKIDSMDTLFVVLEGNCSDSFYTKGKNSFRHIKKGLYLGKIENRGLILEHYLKRGDGIKIVKGKTATKHRINYFLKGSEKVESADAGDEISLKLDRFIDGASVYKISMTDSEVDFNRSPIDVKVEIIKGSLPKVNLTHKGETISVEGTKIVEKAKKAPLSKDLVKEHMQRISKSPFVVNKIDIDMDEDAIIPYSEINRIKRDAIRALIEKNIRRKEVQKLQVITKPVGSTEKPPRIYVKVHDFDSLVAAKEAGADLIYYDIFNYDVSEAVEFGNKNNVPVYLSTPRVIHESGLAHIIKLIEHYDPLGILVSDKALLSDKIKTKKHIHYSFNLTNDISLSYWRHPAMISPELNFAELVNFKNKDYILFSHGKIALMTSKKKVRGSEIISGKTERYEVDRNPYGHTKIFSSKRLMLLDNVYQLYNKGIRKFFLDLPDNVEVIIRRYKDALQGKDTGSVISSGTTTGHLYKGVR